MERGHRPRVLIADDHILVAEACGKLLEPEFEVIGIVPDGRELLRAVPRLQPDVVVLDIGMPLLNGLDAGEQVKQISRRIKLIYLTMNQDPELACEAVRRGASGYLLKTGAASELAVAVRSVLRGKSYISPQIARDMKPVFSHTGKLQATPRITTRQKEVLQLLAEGRSMKEVAYLLELTPRTVAYHKYRIMEVLRLKSTAELVRYAIRSRMIQD